MTHLIEHVADYYGIDPKQLVGPRRNAPLIIPRFVCYFIFRKRFDMSYPQIGSLMHRDHSTVIYGYDKILWLQSRPDIADAIEHLMQVKCSRFIPAWHKKKPKGKKPKAVKPIEQPEPIVIEVRSEYTDPPALCPPKPQPPKPLNVLPRNDFDTDDSPDSGQARFRSGIRKGSNALLAAMRAA